MSEQVSVKVSADSSAFSAGLARIENSLESFKHHASEQFSEVGKDLLAAFAVSAVIEGIRSLFEEFSHVQDLADKLGTSAESVQRLGVVAKAAGVDTETLTKALQKGTKNAFEAATGNAELAAQFEALGIDAKEFANLAPEEQLKEMAEAFEKTGGNAQTLDALTKALGKTALDIIPILRKGPEALKDEMDAANVASADTVATMKEVTETFERLWANFKAYGANAIDWIIKRTQALGTGFAAIYAYVTNLTHGLNAAAKAYDDVIQAAADLQLEEEQKKEEAAKKKKPVDTDAIEAAKAKAEQEKRDAEELAKLKEQNAKKEEEAHYRNLELLQKQKELQEHIAELQNRKPASDLEAEQDKGKILDYQKELEGVNKEIARDKEREEKKLQDELAKEAKDKARDELRSKKEALKEAQKSATELEKLQKGSFSVDNLRQIGGGIAGVNYNLNAAKDDMQRQQLEYARLQVDKLQQIVDKLETQGQEIPSYDGSFN